MFGYMFNVIAWGVFLSLFVIVLAFLAEGRGTRAMEVLRGARRREGKVDLYETLRREDNDWRMLAALAEADRAEAERAGANGDTRGGVTFLQR